MPGLVPGIHVLLLFPRQDGRDKPGHDDVGRFYALAWVTNLVLR
jgi:hypothetical protein